MEWARAALVGLVLVAAAGCGSNDDDDAGTGGDVAAVSSTTEESPETSVPTTPPPAETTTTTAPIDHGAAYLDLVTPLNCTLELLDLLEDEVYVDAYIDETEWPQIRDRILPAYGDYAAALVAFYEGVAAHDWPDDVDADAQALVAEVSADAQWAANVAAADSYQAFLDRLNASSVEGNAAGVLRAKLGLPSNVLDQEGWCDRMGS